MEYTPCSDTPICFGSMKFQARQRSLSPTWALRPLIGGTWSFTSWTRHRTEPHCVWFCGVYSHNRHFNRDNVWKYGNWILGFCNFRQNHISLTPWRNPESHLPHSFLGHCVFNVEIYMPQRYTLPNLPPWLAIPPWFANLPILKKTIQCCQCPHVVSLVSTQFVCLEPSALFLADYVKFPLFWA